MNMSTRESIMKYFERKGESTHFMSQVCSWKIQPRIISVLQELQYNGITACVAGGYASFLAGKTNTYTDIDLFINATSTFMTPQKAKMLLQRIFGSQFHTIKPWDSQIRDAYLAVKRNNYSLAAIVSLHDEVGEIQCIFLDGLAVSQFSPELFCFEVINGFDLFLCKSGFFLEAKSTDLNGNNEEAQDKDALSPPSPRIYSISLQVPTKTFLLEATQDVKEKRKEKYAARDQVEALNPNKLSVISITKIVQSLNNLSSTTMACSSFN